jgi:hypothetical protein
MVDLATGLLARAEPRTRSFQVKPKPIQFAVVRAVPAEHGTWPEKLNIGLGYCKACLTAGRFATSVSKRKVLGNLSTNSIIRETPGSDILMRKKKTPMTRFGCLLCQVHLCQRYLCWEEHILVATQTTPEYPICIN